MKQNTMVLHVGAAESFLPAFFNFLKDYVPLNNHKLLVHKTQRNWSEAFIDVIVAKTIFSYMVYFIKNAYCADKIILHGLFQPQLLLLLFFQPWLHSKCYWFIWGGDLYVYQDKKRDLKWKVREFIRRPVIRNVGHLVTYLEGDVNLARKWYKAKGKYLECLMYPSNLYKEFNLPEKEHSTVNIQVGNSASPSNNHLEIFDMLVAYKEQNIKIFAPLSYGDPGYAKEVIRVGKLLFGEKFVSLTDFMEFNQYLEFLAQVDIAIFNHERQQAMGNTITLLGLGKKVYMRNDVTPWAFFEKQGIKVFGVDKFNISLMPIELAASNKEKIESHFSEQILSQQLLEILDNGGSHALLK